MWGLSESVFGPPSHTVFACCVSVQLLRLQHAVASVARANCPPPPLPLLDTPPHPVHMSVHAYERSNTYVTSHARHAMRMGWSETSLSPGEPLVGQEGRGGGGGKKLGKGGGIGDEEEEEETGKQQAGMEVRKPSLVKEPSKKKEKEKRMKQKNNT